MMGRFEAFRRLLGKLEACAASSLAGLPIASPAKALILAALALFGLPRKAQAADSVSAAATLLEPGESALTLAFWQDALREASQLLSTEAGQQWLASASATLALTYVSLLLGTCVSFVATRFLRADKKRVSAPAAPLLRLLAGIAAPLAVNWILIQAMPAGFWEQLARPLIETSLLATGITAVSLSAALAMLSPGDAALRLLPIGAKAAAGAAFVALVAVFLFGADIVIEHAGGLPAGHEKLAAGGRALLSFSVGALLLAGFGVFAKGHATASPVPGASFLIKPRTFSVLAAAVAIAAAGAALCGYAGLGWFLSVQLMWIATLFCVTYVVWAVLNRFRASYRQAIARARESGASLARFQAPALVFGVSRLLLLLAAFLLALSPFGVRPGETLGEFFQALSGFRVGSIVISLPKIVIAILIVAAVTAAGRGTQRWLSEDFFPTTRLDASLRDALQSSVRYFAIVLGLGLAFVYLGIEIQNVALIASALSIGIGFGLQSIVSNFISGLILLSERRIRKGDWVVIGAEEGFVRHVAIRATEIQTFDNATVVIPNSNLVSGVVKNWLMPDRSGRIRLAVSVCYNSDADRVVKVLTECAARHPEVLVHPEPQALLMKFADSGIDFELRCRIRNITQHPKVRSDLSLAILREFRAVGIDIAFPRRDVRVFLMSRRLGGPWRRNRPGFGSLPRLKWAQRRLRMAAASGSIVEVWLAAPVRSILFMILNGLAGPNGSRPPRAPVVVCREEA